MKVSQLLHAMDKDDKIVVDDFDASVENLTVYSGTVRGIKRDDPINRMHVEVISAVDDVIYILARVPRKEK